MHRINLKYMAAIFGILMMAAGFFAFINPPAKHPVAAQGFAVVELFTSEGCSSCPPADELLSRVQKETAGQPVYLLAYHVDYWNRLGWKDPFSSSAYSERQRQYSQWLKSEVYTPQAVVNGHKEFIVSEDGNLHNAIRNGLQSAAAGQLQVSGLKANHHQLELQYDAGSAAGNNSLVLAVVQKTAVSAVKSGENSGRTLSHVQLVRSFKNISLTGGSKGKATIDLPKGLDNQNMELITFLQNRSNGQIAAAARAAIPANDALAQNTVLK